VDLVKGFSGLILALFVIDKRNLFVYSGLTTLLAKYSRNGMVFSLKVM
jgi:hypothetical protein